MNRKSTWKDAFYGVLDLLNLKYIDQFNVVDCPFIVQDEKEQVDKVKDIPDDVSYIRGRAFKMVVDKPTHIEFDRWTNEEERSGQITDQEKLMLVEYKLSVHKAMIIKPHWANNLSTIQAEQSIKKYGYGSRTLDKYWKVFYEHLKNQ